MFLIQVQFGIKYFLMDQYQKTCIFDVDDFEDVDDDDVDDEDDGDEDDEDDEEDDEDDEDDEEEKKMLCKASTKEKWRLKGLQRENED